MEYQDIISEIIKSLNNLLRQYRFLFTDDEFLIIKKKQSQLKQKKFSSFESLKQAENEFIPYFARVWQYELTNIDNFKVGDNFRFVITCPTTSVEKNNFANRKFISGSLVTDKHMGTFNKINYGISCSVDETNLLSLSKDDSHIVALDENENIAKKYFYTAQTSTGEKLFSKKYLFSLCLPDEIETLMVKDNIVNNGDFIIQDNKAVYSDIILDCRTTKKLGVILFEPCSERDFLEAHALADKYHLKVIPINRKTYFDKISINNNRGQKHLYDLSNLDTIEFILTHFEKLRDEYSNLIINYLSYYIGIKDEKQDNKITINRQGENASIYLAGDNRYFQIDFTNIPGQFNYSIDHVSVTRDVFQRELNAQNVVDEKKNYM